MNSQILLIDQNHSDLGEKIARLRHVNRQTTFPAQLPTGAVLGWLPDFTAPDLGVTALVACVDRSTAVPTRIVLLSPAGTADDANIDQLISIYGESNYQFVMDAAYAVKMVDELEYPYTVVRTLPWVDENVTSQVINEGQPMTGTQVGKAALATLFYRALTTDSYLNQSVGLSGC